MMWNMRTQPMGIWKQIKTMTHNARAEIRHWSWVKLLRTVALSCLAKSFILWILVSLYSYVSMLNISASIIDSKQEENLLNGAILTMMTGNPLHFPEEGTELEERNAVISNNKRQYAEQHGLEYIEWIHQGIGRKDDSRSLKQWDKPYAIYQTLKKNDSLDYVLWMDADAAFIDCQISLPAFISEMQQRYFNETGIETECDIIFSANALGNMNNGVFVAKNTEWTIDFMEKWIHMIEASEYGDQSLMERMIYGFDPYKHNSTQIDEFGERGNQNIDSWPKIAEFMKSDNINDNVRKHMMAIPSIYLNTFDIENKNAFIVHCAGKNKKKFVCQNFDQFILNASSCSV